MKTFGQIASRNRRLILWALELAYDSEYSSAEAIIGDPIYKPDAQQKADRRKSISNAKRFSDLRQRLKNAP